MPGVVGDALGGIVVPVDVGIVPVVVVPVGSVVVGGTVFTVDSVDGPGVVTVQRKFISQHEATECFTNQVDKLRVIVYFPHHSYGTFFSNSSVSISCNLTVAK